MSDEKIQVPRHKKAGRDSLSGLLKTSDVNVRRFFITQDFPFSCYSSTDSLVTGDEILNLQVPRRKKGGQGFSVGATKQYAWLKRRAFILHRFFIFIT